MRRLTNLLGGLALVAGGLTLAPVPGPAQPLPAGFRQVGTVRLDVPYARLAADDRVFFRRRGYEAARTQTRFEARQLAYSVDGLALEAWLYAPRQPAPGRRYPVLVYCRGGTAAFGALDPENLVDFHRWARAGYLVVAPNYRGSRLENGRITNGVDEWGGRDLRDVWALLPLLRGLPEADPDRMVLVGFSRGAVMAFELLRQGFPARAVATVGGVTNLRRQEARRGPEFVEGDSTWPGWRRVWPGYADPARQAEHYRRRSAVAWADSLRVPVLLLHSRTDPRVPVADAQELADSLRTHRRPYRLVLYRRDFHGLARHRRARDRTLLAWLRRYGG